MCLDCVLRTRTQLRIELLMWHGWILVVRYDDSVRRPSGWYSYDEWWRTGARGPGSAVYFCICTHPASSLVRRHSLTHIWQITRILQRGFKINRLYNIKFFLIIVSIRPFFLMLLNDGFYSYYYMVVFSNSCVSMRYRSCNDSLSKSTQFVRLRFPHYETVGLRTHLLSKCWCFADRAS